MRRRITPSRAVRSHRDSFQTVSFSRSSRLPDTDFHAWILLWNHWVLATVASPVAGLRGEPAGAMAGLLLLHSLPGLCPERRKRKAGPRTKSDSLQGMSWMVAGEKLWTGPKHRGLWRRKLRVNYASFSLARPSFRNRYQIGRLEMTLAAAPLGVNEGMRGRGAGRTEAHVESILLLYP